MREETRVSGNKVPRRHVRNSLERKLKANRHPIVDSSIGLYSARRSNLKPDLLRADIMPETETKRTDSNDEHLQVKYHFIEYLETPVKSQNDTNEYRVIRLENGLTALLISDVNSEICASQDNDLDKADSKDEIEDEYTDEDDEEDEEEADDENEDEDTSDKYDEGKKNHIRAACGVCVGVGGFSDPPEIPGMAHFLEHMVFMGSEKYPQENDFHAFLSKHGGTTNAKTDCEHTTFYFDVQEKYLLPTLDRFAQFFIKPLMKKDAITRERESVGSEFQSGLPYDENRNEQLFSSFARAGHPARKFIRGNLITLRDNVDDDKLYTELHKFRERHYSANRMKLAIQARLSLDILEKYVTTCFTDVPSNGLPPDDFTEFKGGISFDTPAFRRMYKIKPVKDLSQLEVTWVMPSLLDFYKSKPLQYVSCLIGYHENGSLISYLRKKLWGFDMLSGNCESGFAHSSMYAFFNLTVQLTDEGQKHLEEVLDAIFSFINLLRMEGAQKKIYNEIYKIGQNKFIFPGGENTTKYILAKDLCRSMHYYPPRDYISGNKLHFQYDAEAIQMCLDYLKPENANIMISNGRFNAELDKTEPWFKTRYTDVEIPPEWIDRWKTIKPLLDFHLPSSNIFLSSDFTLIPLPKDIPIYPVKIHKDTISEIWYRPDPKFRLPECYMYFHFVSPLGFQSPENAVLMDLYCSVLKQLCAEEISPATVARLHFEIYASDRGIIMTLNGFNEKLPLLLFTVVKYMVDYPNLVTKELFEVMKEQELKGLYNSFIIPRDLISDVQLYLFKRIHYTYVDMYTALREVNFEKFQSFIKSFNDCLYIQCLVQGNMSQDTVLENVRLCIEIINCKSLLPSMIPQIRVMQPPLGTNYCKLRNMDRTDVNSVVMNYYQAEVASIELKVLLELLRMVMVEPLFNQLRTKEQLGYDVSCFAINAWGILGYCILVQTQADNYTTEHVDQRIEDFLKSFNKILEDLSEKDLDIVKEGLRQMKQCADIDLHEEVKRNWREIIRWEYMFDRHEKEVLAMKDIKLSDLREWIAKHTLNGSNFRKLSIHVVGRNSKENTVNGAIDIAEDCNKMQYSLEYINKQDKKTEDYYITDVEDYKKDLYIYPVNEGINPLKAPNNCSNNDRNLMILR
ncbi:unnamed protein product [Lasius platythorax]